SRDESAQGIVATVSKIRFEELESLIESASHIQFPLLLILDRIQDPQNFGAILRSAAFFKVDGVIIQKEQQAPVNETVIKTSAGGAFHLKIARVTNLHQTIMLLKKSGYWIATSAAKAPLSVSEMDTRVPLAVIVGNEGSGVKRILRDKSDMTFSIPQIGRIDSLNVSVATGIICYEVLRQRGNQK
ncbi:MAG: 23S rRNA (guanosine(2251)-2'-O)-methyltransferase RlmB, partial [Candidatus Kryptoniota bacterium]